MLFQTMELIRQNLNSFLRSFPNAPANMDAVVLGNIAYATPDNPGTPQDESAQIYMSLVNVEEEATLKNQSAIRQNEAAALSSTYINPPLFVNLYLLFSANHHNYSRAIEELGRVILFFQSNRSFSLKHTPVTLQEIFATPGEAENRIHVTLDLMSLTFEQINHLWGSLGGKQMPFLLYKARKVEIDANRKLAEGGGRITEIQIA